MCRPSAQVRPLALALAQVHVEVPGENRVRLYALVHRGGDLRELAHSVFRATTAGVQNELPGAVF